MRLDEEEVLIRDDSGLLHSNESAYPVRQNGWWKKLRRTMSLSLGFFALGLCFAIPGPTLLDLGDQVQASVAQMMVMFAARSVGYLLGAVLGGVLFDCFDKQLLLFCTLLISSIATIAIPWSLTLVVMATMFGLQGITMGVLDTGGNVFCIRLWGKKSGPYMQTLHFAFGIGAFIAPLLATPFLSTEMVTYNASLLEGNIPVSPFLLDKIHHNRTVRSEGLSLDDSGLFYKDLQYIKDIHEANFHIYRDKRSENSSVNNVGTSTLQTTIESIAVGASENSDIQHKNIPNPNKEGVDITSSEDSVLGKGDTTKTVDNGSDIAKNAAVNKTESDKNIDSVQTNSSNPIPESSIVNMSSTPSSTLASVESSTHVSEASTIKAPSTVKLDTDVPASNKKPSAATDADLKPSYIDGEQMGTDLDHQKDEHEGINSESEQLSFENLNSTVSTVSPATLTNNHSSIIENKRNITETSQETLVTSTVSDLFTYTKANETAIKSSSSATASTAQQVTKTLSTTPPALSTTIQVGTSTTVAVPTTSLKVITKEQSEGTSPPTTTIKPSSTTTSTSTSTTVSTTEVPSSTTIAATTTTTTTTTTEQVTTPSTTQPVTTQPTTTLVVHSVDKDKLTTTLSTLQQTSTLKVDSSPPPLVSPTSTTSNSNVVNSSTPAVNKTASSGPPQVTEISMKPSTTKDSFLNNAIKVIRNISRIQFAYLIIGLVLFLNAVIFLVLYCRDKGRLSSPSEVDEYLGAKNVGKCSRSTLTALMGLFLLCYMGLEVTYGALVTSFVVDSMHWPKAEGATVAAIFWGSLAAGRGFSIFIARCCGPVMMLSIDLVLMVIGGLVLSIGLYFYARLIWLGTLVLGLGMSSIFPAGLSWAENYIHLTGKTTAIFTLGSGLGQIIFPTVTGYFFEHYEKSILMHIAAGSSVFLLILFIVIQCLASRSSQKVYVQDRNGFLPLEDAEEENMELDLIHFDRSETSRRRDKRARGETEYKTLISDLDDD